MLFPVLGGDDFNPQGIAIDHRVRFDCDHDQ
jgi:hypothetical protein